VNKMSIDFQKHIDATAIANSLLKPKQNGSGWMACCPAHDDQNPSLSISDGDDGKILVKCFAGCTQTSVIDALKGKGLWPEQSKNKLNGKNSTPKETQKKRIVETYDYKDLNSKLVYQIVRQEPKFFPQRQPDGNGGWIWNLQGVTQVPYRLPDFIKCDSVVVVEGEKDANQLWDIGISATTNSGGAGNWSEELNQYFKNKEVYIIQDNDDAGRRHVGIVASNLKEIAASIRICTICSEMPEKADVSDWLDAGNDPSTLFELLESFPEYEPEIEEVTNKMQLETDFSEDSLALLFIARHGNIFRWTAGRDWQHYDGTVWQRDQRKSYYSYIQKLCREQIVLRQDHTSITRVRSAKTRNGVAELAKHDPRIAMLDEAFVSDPHLLNTPTGIVDLRNGKIRPNCPEDYCTQITSVSPSNEPPKLFLKTLNEIFLNNEEIIAFVQRLLGYTTTGLTTEQVIVFFYGSGANGKSLLLDLVARILGTYAIKLPINVLMQSKHQRHETEIAQLDGVRLAISSEPEQGAAWAEAKIKELTGDRTIRGRFMRKDFYEFSATHKHLVAGNYKPRLTGSDPAIARRVKLVPFLANFEGAKCDPDLPEKLFAEASQILGLLINGAKQWYENGLQVPEAIGNASHEYMAEMDDLGVWMDERCDVSPEYTEKSSALYADFKTWKDFKREPVLSQTVFGKQLSSKGFEKKKSNGVMSYKGIELSLTREKFE
jgi:putative DNA primase/helicase